jgi:hypothetical protein
MLLNPWLSSVAQRVRAFWGRDKSISAFCPLPFLLNELRRKGIAKGVVIASAKREQYAADVAFDDFYAGAPLKPQS